MLCRGEDIMDTKVATNIIRQIAKENYTTEEVVKSEIKAAILAGYSNQSTRNKWSEIFGEGVLPSPEEFIIIMSGNIVASAL